MGYCISYEEGGNKKRLCGDKRKIYTTTIASMLLLLTIFTLICFFKDKDVRKALLPGDGAVTEAAINNFAESVQNGVGVGDAVAAFCREIIENAE